MGCLSLSCGFHILTWAFWSLCFVAIFQERKLVDCLVGAISEILLIISGK